MEPIEKQNKSIVILELRSGRLGRYGPISDYFLMETKMDTERNIEFEQLHPSIRRLLDNRVLPKSEEELLFRQERYDTIFEHNWRLCYSIAKKFMGRYVPLEELIIEAAGILWEVIIRHDHKVSKLSTHATPNIKRALEVFCTNYHGAVPVKDYLTAPSRQLRELTKVLAAELGRQPTRDDIAQSDEFKRIKKTTRLAEDNLLDLWYSLRQTVSLDEPTEEDGNVLLIDTLETPQNESIDYTPHEFRSIEQLEINELLDYYMSPLTDQERLVFVTRHFNKTSKKEVGLIIGKNPKTVDRWDANAQEKIHDHILSDDYLRERVKRRLGKKTLVGLRK